MLLGVIGGVIIVQAAAVLAIALPTGGIMTTRQIYRETFVPDLTVSHFGLATTLRLDIEQTLFGLEEPSRPDPGEGSVSTLAPGNVSVQPEEPEEGETPAASGPNVMDIDFDALIANETDSTLKDMHEYFRDRTPHGEKSVHRHVPGQESAPFHRRGFLDRRSERAVHPHLIQAGPLRLCV